MAAIHQFTAGFANGDAISNEARVLQRVFRSWGYDSDIFSETRRILPALRKQARDLGEYVPVCKPGDVVLLHLSIGSPANTVFTSLPCRKAILYHNVTPSHYFDLINKQTAYDLAAGRDQVKALAGAADVNMADSAFNASELTALGYRDVHVLPLVLDLEKLRSAPDPRILKRFDDGMANVLFVGRCAPNKKIDDVLKAFSCFQEYVEPASRLIHVGSFAGVERYYYLVLTQAREMGISNVHFAGSVPQHQLNAYYKCADVFLCMSEHEGFCIPVIESMVHDVPVMAYAAGAVRETMDGAGILFSDKRYELLAEMMGKVVHDKTFRAAVVHGQRERVARYAGRDLGEELRSHLAPLLAT